MLFIILLLTALDAQQITNGLHYLQDKFQTKLDTNLYYFHQLRQENDRHCVSISSHCYIVNKQLLSDYIDHTLDQQKPDVITQIFHLIKSVEDRQVLTYYVESTRVSLDKPLDKHKYF